MKSINKLKKIVHIINLIQMFNTYETATLIQEREFNEKI